MTLACMYYSMCYTTQCNAVQAVYLVLLMNQKAPHVVSKTVYSV